MKSQIDAQTKRIFQCEEKLKQLQSAIEFQIGPELKSQIDAQKENPCDQQEIKEQIDELQVSINEYKRWVPEVEMKNNFMED